MLTFSKSESRKAVAHIFHNHRWVTQLSLQIRSFSCPLDSILSDQPVEPLQHQFLKSFSGFLIAYEGKEQTFDMVSQASKSTPCPSLQLHLSSLLSKF